MPKNEELISTARALVERLASSAYTAETAYGMSGRLTSMRLEQYQMAHSILAMVDPDHEEFLGTILLPRSVSKS